MCARVHLFLLVCKSSLLMAVFAIIDTFDILWKRQRREQLMTIQLKIIATRCERTFDNETHKLCCMRELRPMCADTPTTGKRTLPTHTAARFFLSFEIICQWHLFSLSPLIDGHFFFKWNKFNPYEWHYVPITFDEYVELYGVSSRRPSISLLFQPIETILENRQVHTVVEYRDKCQRGVRRANIFAFAAVDRVSMGFNAIESNGCHSDCAIISFIITLL